MGLQIAPAEETPSSDRHSTTDTHLRGRWLVSARATWIALLALNVGVFVASAPARFAHSPDDSAIEVALLLAYTIIAVVIFWHKSDDWMALFASIFLVTWAATASPSWDALESHPAWSLPVRFLRTLGPTSLLIFLYLFPDGRFIPHWTRALTVVIVVLTLAAQPFGPLALPDPFSFLLWIGFLGIGVVAQIYRYVRISGLEQRQQTKWVVFGVTAMSLGLFAASLLGEIVPSPNQSGDQQALYELVSGLIAVCSLLLLPLSIGIAILRYRLWDIDIIINRTLVYGALSASVVGIYVLVIGALGALFQARGDLAISLIATALVALLFQPLREHIQRGVNRLMYGERDDPYAVLARLGQRLEVALAPDAVLPTIVQTVTEALKLPYAALALNGPAGLTVVAVHGTPADTPLHLPLSYQNEPVGELRLALRAAGEAFSPADQRLLNDLARQAGVAAYAVRLTADLRRVNAELQRSRARLVTAREEERRRLRRDLHDGLGPALAAQTLKVGTAKYLVPRDPPAAEALLTELEADIGAALAQIRQVVYNLRPPALDELGLVGAIRASAGQYYSQSANAGGGDDLSGLRVVVVAPERLAALPAAVEVAAYRIVHEALANVVRHAHAQTCQIQLALEEQGEQMLLCLDITDDGCGLPRARRQGVGLTAMRERAAELGGACVVAPGPSGGTWVSARLPLAQSPELADQDRAAR